MERRLPVDDVRFRPLGVRRFIFKTDVDGHVIVAHVEAPVDPAEEGVEASGQDVLAQVTLHVLETVIPVDGAVGVQSGKILQLLDVAFGGIGDVPYLPMIVFVDMGDGVGVLPDGQKIPISNIVDMTINTK